MPLLHLTLALVAAEALSQFKLRWFWNWLLAGLVFFSLLFTYLLLPTNPGVPKYHFDGSLTKPEPLDPKRLYLSIYPPPESAYRVENRPAPVGQVTRPGSTSMWAGLRLVNGYSPIRGAGVGRALAFSTHGEIDPGMADYLIRSQAGRDGLLGILGIDGLIVADESYVPPPSPDEWALVHVSAEGRVYHRRGQPLPAIRALESLGTLPDKRWGRPAIEMREDARNELAAEIDVPQNGLPVLLAISRPYFDGYRAEIGRQCLTVDSYRGLIPVIQLAPGTHGRLTITYRPWWLVWGGMIAAASALIWVVGAWRACLVRRRAPAS